MRQAFVAIFLVALALAATASAQDAPAVDHHQHLYSPGIAALISPPWAAFCQLPLTTDEFRAIARNVASYLR